jgi:hypothetical protein
VPAVTSVALKRWTTTAQAALDEIANAHVAVGGKGRGRRFATLQVNHAYAMLVSSQFQGFCRDLHTEAVDVLVSAARPAKLGSLLQAVMIQGRKLDQGNPNPSHLGADFSRLGMPFWQQVNALSARNAARQTQLEELNSWRNAIAHQDWTKVGPDLRLSTVKTWRANCAVLAKAFDTAVGDHLAGLVGTRPWC